MPALEKRYKNAVRCRKCGDRIVSTHVHDWVRCKCGAIYIDGGNEYWRAGGNPEDFEQLWEPLEEVTKC